MVLVLTVLEEVEVDVYDVTVSEISSNACSLLHEVLPVVQPNEKPSQTLFAAARRTCKLQEEAVPARFAVRECSRSTP